MSTIPSLILLSQIYFGTDISGDRTPVHLVKLKQAKPEKWLRKKIKVKVQCMKHPSKLKRWLERQVSAIKQVNNRKQSH